MSTLWGMNILNDKTRQLQKLLSMFHLLPLSFRSCYSTPLNFAPVLFITAMTVSTLCLERIVLSTTYLRLLLFTKSSKKTGRLDEAESTFLQTEILESWDKKGSRRWKVETWQKTLEGNHHLWEAGYQSSIYKKRAHQTTTQKRSCDKYFNAN